MFIDLNKNNGKDYLRLVESVRVLNKNGYKVSQKRTILNIGPLDRFDSSPTAARPQLPKLTIFP